MRKGFLIYEEMRKYFPIYEEASSHIWLCNCSIVNFLIYEENLIFFFISVAWDVFLFNLLGRWYLIMTISGFVWTFVAFSLEVEYAKIFNNFWRFLRIIFSISSLGLNMEKLREQILLLIFFIATAWNIYYAYYLNKLNEFSFVILPEM
jgi:hypothetical protein